MGGHAAPRGVPAACGRRRHRMTKAYWGGGVAHRGHGRRPPGAGHVACGGRAIRLACVCRNGQWTMGKGRHARTRGGVGEAQRVCGAIKHSGLLWDVGVPSGGGTRPRREQAVQPGAHVVQPGAQGRRRARERGVLVRCSRIRSGRVLHLTRRAPPRQWASCKNPTKRTDTRGLAWGARVPGDGVR